MMMVMMLMMMAMLCLMNTAPSEGPSTKA